mmetsp:Transcript_21787/g.60677  ORF Transcript_21787/g.60677 Transcript_21787/m.60677 type:complete len:452 (-) Transcript_21787:210-1565(-)
MAAQDGSLEDGLRQLLAMRGSERQAALAALSGNQPSASPQAPPARQGSRGSGLEHPAWSGGGCPAGLAAGPGLWPSESAGGMQHAAPMKVPLPADCGGFMQQEAYAGPAFRQSRSAPRAPPPRQGEDDCNQLVQSMTNAMSRILLDGAHGQAAGNAAVREERLRHIEWLRGQLELQQEQSMRKISHMFDHRASAAAPASPPAAAAAAPSRRSPLAAQGYPLAGPRGQRPQEADEGSALQRPRNMKRRGDDNSQVTPVPVHAMAAMPGWDPRLALAAAEAAGSVPSHWAPANVESPSRAAWPKKHAQASQRMSGEEQQQVKMASDTLRSHLRALQEVDSRRVVQVRKISKLGFQSGAALESHYSAFGKVECVRVAFSHVKPQSTGLAVRIRPSGLGFVVMSSIEEAEKIIEAGENQVVNGVEVLVRPYEVRAASEKEPTNEDNNEDDLLVGA